MKKIKKSSQAGFTLVEMIIYIALMTVLLTALTEILVSLINVKLESESTSAVETDARYILARLNYDLGRMLPTDTITAPTSLGSSGNSLTFTINGTPRTYSLVGTNFQINDGIGTFNLNSSESLVSTINPVLFFTKIGNPGGKESIKISFHLDSRAQSSSGPEQRNYFTTLGRR